MFGPGNDHLELVFESVWEPATADRGADEWGRRPSRSRRCWIAGSAGPVITASPIGSTCSPGTDSTWTVRS